MTAPEPASFATLQALLAQEPALLARLVADDATVRRIALIELADLEDEAHLPWLLHALHDPAAEVRAEAARRLAAWERADGVAGLLAALDDPDAAVRQAAADSLAELQLPQAAPWLLPSLRHPSAFVRASALRALKPLRHAPALDPAAALLDDADAAVRLEAVGVLGWLRDAASLPRLARLATDDPQAEVRRAAAGALGSAAAPDARLQAALQAALKDADWTVREEAASTLGKLRWDAARDALGRALDDEAWQVRQRAARSLGRLGAAASAQVPALCALLGHEGANVRKEVVIALGEIRDPQALPALQDAAADADPDVRKLARLAITLIAGAHAVRDGTARPAGAAGH